MKKLVAAAALCVSVIATAGSATSAPATMGGPPPASAFGDPAAVRMVAISPDGQHLALASREGDQTLVKMVTLDRNEATFAKLGDVEITRLRWLGNDRVIVDANFVTKIYNSYRTVGRVVSVSAQDGRGLVMFADNKPTNNLLRHEVYGVSPDQKLLMKGYSTLLSSRPLPPLLLKVDPVDGHTEQVEEGVGGVLAWIIGDDGAAHGRTLVLNKSFIVQTRVSPTGAWRDLWSVKLEDADQYRGYSAPDDAIVIREKTPEGDQLKLKHLTDAKVTLLGAPHKTEPQAYLWDPHARRPTGRIFGGERAETEWLDSDLAAVHATLSKAFKAADVRLLDWSEDHSRFVFSVFAPDMPTAFYLYDKPRREVSALGEMHPGLKGAKLGATRWITYKARDGLELHAYVTTPPDARPGQRFPVVVLPHPLLQTRDIYDFDYVAQFLATRGYVVLRPQYRGSATFGDDFEKAGDWEWGAKIETDLLDGVASLAAEGVVDPKRACIVGADFAGYLALAAATLYPNDYACAVSQSGASDLTGIVSGWGGAPFASMRKVLKDVDPRDPRYAAMSPRVHAANARSPILLVWNDQDSTMPPEQSKAMGEALAAAHKAYETLIISDPHNDHLTGKSATQFLEALSAFLAKNLPVQP